MLHAAEFIINQSFQLARDPDRIIKRSKPKTNKTTFIPKHGVEKRLKDGVIFEKQIINFLTLYGSKTLFRP